MRKSFLSIIIAMIVLVVALLCCKWLWTGGEQEPHYTSTGAIVSGEEDDCEVNEQVAGLQTYENGLAEFTYDIGKIVFMEMPSDDEEGYPMTSFLLNDTEDVLPRLDVLPLKLTEPFTESVTVEEWQELVKSLILAYYSTLEQESVKITFADGVVKVDNEEAKMYVYVTTTLEGSSTPDMSGVIRLTANNESAVVTLALARKGEAIPSEIEDVYMSINLQ